MTDDEIEVLQSQIDSLHARMDALSKRLDTLKTVAIGDRELTYDDVEEAPSLWDQLDALDAELAEVEDTAATAAAVAKDKRADGGQTTKVDVAKTLARDEVVRRALAPGDDAAQATITVSKVQEMARPNHDLKYQTVKDAFSELVTTWPEMLVKQSPRRLCVTRSELTRECVLAVEESLGRDDLTKRLISDSAVGGGSA